MGYLVATGLEHADSSQVSLSASGFASASISTSRPHTGQYSLYTEIHYGDWGLAEGYIPIDSATEIWVNCWFYFTNSEAGNGFRLVMGGTNNFFYIDTNASNQLVAYLNNVGHNTGAYPIAGAWNNIKIHQKIDNVNGIMEFMLNGGAIISYTGSTNTAPITYMGIRINSKNQYQVMTMYLDDVTVKDDGWPLPLTYTGLRPDGDDSVEWTPSAGSNYQCIDERPPSDADYVETINDGDIDLYNLPTYTPVGAEIIPVVTQYVRGRRDSSDVASIKMIADVGGVQNISTDIIQPSTLATQKRFLTSPPAGGSWSVADLNALKVGYESVI